MEYERIHKVQTGVISPSKLRMKLLGVQNHRRKEGATSSSRTSPSRLEDLEYAKNSLLENEENETLKDSEDDSGRTVTVANVEPQEAKLPKKDIPNCDQNGIILKEKNDAADIGTENASEGVLSHIHSVNSRTIHPVRSLAEESNGYDSGHDNGSTSIFEFHRGERVLPSPIVGPFSRPVPSKWNDAEKWIINRQSVHPHTNVLKKTLMQQRQGNQKMIANLGKVAPESVTTDQGGSSVPAADTKKIDSYHPQTVGLRFPFASFGSHPASEPEQGTSGSVDFSLNVANAVVLFRTHKDLNQKEICMRENSGHASVPSVKSVCMRDMGTEMTPVASQEPSRTGTPNGAMTPIRSPFSSRSSTPRRGAPAPSPFESTADDKPDHQENSSKTEYSEREHKLKTRKEIFVLGLQLGKTNIAAWASKDDVEDDTTSHKVVDMDQLKKIEFESRAAAWEEAEKTKHMARFKREEIKIQVWESHQKAKFEAQMREVEAQAEMMKAQAQEKMMKKLSLVKQHSEEKLAAAKARKHRDATRTAQQVEHIRRTGRAPLSLYFCCPWLS